jgi:hypothetical protein
MRPSQLDYGGGDKEFYGVISWQSFGYFSEKNGIYTFVFCYLKAKSLMSNFVTTQMFRSLKNAFLLRLNCIEKNANNQ